MDAYNKPDKQNKIDKKGRTERLDGYNTIDQ
jgi:hypothetical protein